MIANARRRATRTSPRTATNGPRRPTSVQSASMRPMWMAKSVARRRRSSPGRRAGAGAPRRGGAGRPPARGIFREPQGVTDRLVGVAERVHGRGDHVPAGPQDAGGAGERHDPRRGGVPEQEERAGGGQVAAVASAARPSARPRRQPIRNGISCREPVDQKGRGQQEYEAGADQGGRGEDEEPHHQGKAAAPGRRAPRFRADPPLTVHDFEHPGDDQKGPDEPEWSLARSERRHGRQPGEEERNRADRAVRASLPGTSIGGVVQGQRDEPGDRDRRGRAARRWPPSRPGAGDSDVTGVCRRSRGGEGDGNGEVGCSAGCRALPRPYRRESGTSRGRHRPGSRRCSPTRDRSRRTRKSRRRCGHPPIGGVA